MCNLHKHARNHLALSWEHQLHEYVLAWFRSKLLGAHHQKAAESLRHNVWLNLGHIHFYMRKKHMQPCLMASARDMHNCLYMDLKPHSNTKLRRQ
jgi:hypothetical protein